MLPTSLLAVIFFTATVCSYTLATSDNNAETLIDEFIYQTVQDLKKNHEEQLALPDIDLDFKKKIAFFKVRGEFIGKGGWLRDLTTLKRTAPSEFQEKDDSILLGITLGLDEMEFGFKEYRVEVFHIGVHGTMRVTVQKNSVYLLLNIKSDEKGDCKTTLDKVEVKKLEGFHADMTGLGRDVDWVYSFIATLLANKYHGHIEKSVSEKLTPVLNNILAKNDLCQLFPH